MLFLVNAQSTTGSTARLENSPTPTPEPTGTRSPYTHLRVWNLCPFDSPPIKIESEHPSDLGVLDSKARQDRVLDYRPLQADTYIIRFSTSEGKELARTKIDAKKASFYTIIYRPSSAEIGKTEAIVQTDTYPVAETTPVQFHIYNAVPECTAFATVGKNPPLKIAGSNDQVISGLPIDTTSIDIQLQVSGLRPYHLDLPIDPNFGRHATVLIYRDAYRRVIARLFYEGYSKSDIAPDN